MKNVPNIKIMGIGCCGNNILKYVMNQSIENVGYMALLLLNFGAESTIEIHRDGVHGLYKDGNWNAVKRKALVVELDKALTDLDVLFIVGNAEALSQITAAGFPKKLFTFRTSGFGEVQLLNMSITVCANNIHLQVTGHDLIHPRGRRVGEPREGGARQHCKAEEQRGKAQQQRAFLAFQFHAFFLLFKIVLCNRQKPVTAVLYFSVSRGKQKKAMAFCLLRRCLP